MTNFQLACKFTLGASIEGGISNIPGDHGGLTNNGVTQATYDAYREQIGLPKQSVTLITKYEEENLYHLMFWIAARCNLLGLKLSVAHFDWAVNHGPFGAIVTLQKAAGVTPDGIFGPITNQAVNKADPLVLLDAYLNQRIDDYHQIAKDNPSQSEFLAGWIDRVHKLRGYLKTL